MLLHTCSGTGGPIRDCTSKHFLLKVRLELLSSSLVCVGTGLSGNISPTTCLKATESNNVSSNLTAYLIENAFLAILEIIARFTSLRLAPSSKTISKIQ